MQFPSSRMTLHTAAVATADGAIMDVTGCSSVCVQIQGVTTATITWKARNDGSNWVTIPAKNKASGVEATTATADGLYDVPVHGCTEFIADITAWTAGTITITAVGIAGGVQAPHTAVAAVVGAIDTELPAAAALADNTANPTVPGVGAFSLVWDGATWDRLPGNSTDGVFVAGAVAHDAADAGGPVKQGFKATTSLAGLTLVANADRTNGFAGIDGVQIVRPHCNLEDIVTGNANNTDGTSTSVIATAGAGIKQYLTSVILTNTSSSNIYVEMKSGTTVKATIPLPANSGAIFNPSVPLPPNAADEAWSFDPSAAATTVYCTAIGFKSKV